MSTQQKRFTSEQQILDAIDANLQKGNDKIAEAAELEKSAKEYFKAAWEAEQKRDHTKARRRATVLLERKSKRLSERLAEFRTGSVVPLLGLKGVGDMSVEGVK